MDQAYRNHIDGPRRRARGEYGSEDIEATYNEDKHNWHRLRNKEIHKITLEILQDKRAAQKLLWEKTERFLAEESAARIRAILEVRDAQLKAVAAEHKVRIQNDKDRHEMDLEGLNQLYIFRRRLLREDQDVLDTHRREMHELGKNEMCGLNSELVTDNQGQKVDEREEAMATETETVTVEYEPASTPDDSSESEDRYTSALERNCRKRQRSTREEV